MRTRVSLAMSLVPITRASSRDSESFALAASARMRNSAIGVSIIAHSRVRWSVRMSSRRWPIISICSGVEIFGTSTASGAAWAAAVRSSACHGVSMPLMRTTTSRSPKPRAVTAAMT